MKMEAARKIKNMRTQIRQSRGRKDDASDSQRKTDYARMGKIMQQFGGEV